MQYEENLFEKERKYRNDLEIKTKQIYDEFLEKDRKRRFEIDEDKERFIKLVQEKTLENMELYNKIRELKLRQSAL